MENTAQYNRLPVVSLAKLKEISGRLAEKSLAEEAGLFFKIRGTLKLERNYFRLYDGDDMISVDGNIDRNLDGQAVECIGFPYFSPYKDHFYCNFKVLESIVSVQIPQKQDSLDVLQKIVKDRHAVNLETKSLTVLLSKITDEERKAVVHILCSSDPSSQIFGDIFQNLQDCQQDIVRIPVSMKNPDDIAEKIREAVSAHADILLLARGGGDSQDFEVFNNETVLNALFDFNGFLITALGHSGTFTLADSVADAHFSTPNAAGRFLRETLEFARREKTAKDKEVALDEKDRELAAREKSVAEKDALLEQKAKEQLENDQKGEEASAAKESEIAALKAAIVEKDALLEQDRQKGERSLAEIAALKSAIAEKDTLLEQKAWESAKRQSVSVQDNDRNLTAKEAELALREKMILERESELMQDDRYAHLAALRQKLAEKDALFRQTRYGRGVSVNVLIAVIAVFLTIIGVMLYLR